MSLHEDICVLLGLEPEDVDRLVLIVQKGRMPELTVRFARINEGNDLVVTKQKYTITPIEL